MCRTSPGTSTRSSTARAPRAPTRMLAEADERAARVRRALRRQASPSSTGPGSPRRWPSSQAIAELVGRAGNYAHLRFSVDTLDPANGALVARVEREGDRGRDEAPVLRPRVGRARRRARRRAARAPTASTRAATTCARSAATGRTCSPSPRRRSSTEKAVSGREAWARLFEEQTSAIKVDSPGDEEPVKLDVALAPAAARPTARCAATTAEARHRRARAGPAHARLHLQHAARRTRRPTTGCAATRRWISSRNLANEASDESVQALVEAVRARLRPPAALVPAEGAACSGLDRLADYDRMAAVAHRGGEGRSGPRRRELVLDAVRRLLRRAGTTRPSASSTSTGSTRPVRPGKRGGAFCAYTRAERAPVRDAQLHRPPARRAHARARARPRRARRARPSRAGSSSSTRR